MSSLTPVALSWSGGKDSALALRTLQTEGRAVHALLTTVTDGYRRVSMHGVREELLDLQAERAGLPLRKVRIPKVATNEIYEAQMAAAVTALQAEGIEEFAFGDLFLEDIRAYRERQLARVGARALFPVWGIDTAELAREFIALGLRAILVTVDPRQLSAEFAGREYDEALLRDLPQGVDPCGENGEFHTFVYEGPIFQEPIPVWRGEVVQQGGFVFQDLLPKR